MIRNGNILDAYEYPSKGWGKEPDAHAMRVGDDIERIQHLRSKLCHSTFADMTESDFNSFTKDAKDVMHRHSDETGMTLLSDVDTVVNTVLSAAQVYEIRQRLVLEMKRTFQENTSE